MQIECSLLPLSNEVDDQHCTVTLCFKNFKNNDLKFFNTILHDLELCQYPCKENLARTGVTATAESCRFSFKKETKQGKDHYIVCVPSCNILQNLLSHYENPEQEDSVCFCRKGKQPKEIRLNFSAFIDEVFHQRAQAQTMISKSIVQRIQFERAMEKKNQTQMKLNAARMRIIQTKEFMGKRVLSLVYGDVPGIDEDVTHKYIIE